LKRHRGLLGTILLAGALVAGIAFHYREVRYDRFYLPAFDGHVYALMAERPAFFTVAPWGYRVLTPWLVSLGPGRDPTRGFFWLTHLGMVAAATLLFLYLRQLGHGVGISRLALAAFLLSPPSFAILRYQVLVEPLSVALEILFLLALQAGAGWACLGLVAILGVLNKEFFLLLLPLVYLTRARSQGRRRALLATGLVALPAVWVLLSLYLGWTSVAVASGAPSRLTNLLARGRQLGSELGGLGALLTLGTVALWGAVRHRSRPVRLTAAWTLLVTIVPPLLNPFHFSASDLKRLLIYALPPALALCCAALDQPRPRHPWPRRLGLEAAATGLVIALLALPLAILDPYRRIELRGEQSAPTLWATLHGSLAVAAELDRGRPVSFGFEPRLARESLPPLLQAGRSRWILREGFGPDLRSGTAEVLLVGKEGRILLPCLRPQGLTASLEMAGRPGQTVSVFVNGIALGTLVLGGEPTTQRVFVPARLLFRGDNLLALAPSTQGPPRPRLFAVTFAPGPSRRPGF